MAYNLLELLSAWEGGSKTNLCKTPLVMIWNILFSVRSYRKLIVDH